LNASHYIHTYRLSSILNIVIAGNVNGKEWGRDVGKIENENEVLDWEWE